MSVETNDDRRNSDDFLDDEEDEVEPPCVLQKTLGESQGRSGKKYGERLQTLHLKRQNMAPYLVRRTEIWKKHGGKYGGLALEIMGLRVKC